MRDLFGFAVCSALLGLAVLTVAARNLFRAALALLGVLFATAILFLLLQAELVALVQVMVYIGGIMIFVLYAVLLTSELGGHMPAPAWRASGSAAAVSLASLIALAGFFRSAGTGSEGAVGNIASVKSLGLRLLDAGPGGFLVPFELVSVLLLAAMVGAIAIARPSGAAEGKAEPQAGP
ncbi:MAG: NADH-quinone oxidoreductase subunit J [Fibrobacteres bacterium]|nr:NADH-quinone oxidoreductase subunit J [Fibrobacterota bacterium]